MNTFSVILDENGKRICYKDYLLSCRNTDLNISAKRVIGRINLKKINDIINEIPYISEKRKNFYKDMILMRYEKIMIPTLQNLFYRNRSEIDSFTAELVPKDIKNISENIVSIVRNADLYIPQKINFQDSDNTLYFRKASGKPAIFYNQKGEVSGIAPIGKDYQDVKAFFFEMNISFQEQGEKFPSINYSEQEEEWQI